MSTTFGIQYQSDDGSELFKNGVLILGAAGPREKYPR